MAPKRTSRTLKRVAFELVEFVVQYQTMIKLNVHEAKTHLSSYLARLEAGETILLCRRNVPIAEIGPLTAPRRDPRPIGLAKDTFAVPASFFEPLPEQRSRLSKGGMREAIAGYVHLPVDHNRRGRTE